MVSRPLLASREGHSEMVSTLAKEGVDVNQASDSGVLPLHCEPL